MRVIIHPFERGKINWYDLVISNQKSNMKGKKPMDISLSIYITNLIFKCLILLIHTKPENRNKNQPIQNKLTFF